LTLALLALAGVLAAAGRARADGTSKSYSDWRIHGSTAELRVSFAPHDFATFMPDLDLNHDLKIDTKELEPGRARVGEMVVKETELKTARAKTDPLEACRAGAPSVVPVGEPLQEVQVQLTFECSGPIGALELRAHYLPTLEPPHVGVATITAPEKTAQHVFTRAAPVFTLEMAPASLASELQDALARGAKAALSISLALFLVVLSIPVPFKRGLGLFALFAGVEVLAVVLGKPLAAPLAGVLPFVAVLSVAWAGAEAFVLRPNPARQLALTACFGLVHGLAAAAHASSSAPIPERIAFTLGAIAPTVLISGIGVVLAAVLAPYTKRVRRPVAL
jgi:hypothetical protein